MRTHFSLTSPKAQAIARYLVEKGEASPREIIKNTDVDRSTIYSILKLLLKDRIIEREKISHKNVRYSLTEKGRVEYETITKLVFAFRGNYQRQFQPISRTIPAKPEKGWPEVKYQIVSSIPCENWRESAIANGLLTQCILNTYTGMLASVHTFTNYPIPVFGEFDSTARGKFLDRMLNSQFGLCVVMDLKPVSGKRIPLPPVRDDFSRSIDLAEKPLRSAKELEELMTPFVLAVLSRYQHRGFLFTSLHISCLVLHLLRSSTLHLEDVDIASFENIVQSILKEKVKQGEIGELKGYFRITQDMQDYRKKTHLALDEVQFQRCPEKILDEAVTEDVINQSKEYQRDLLGREQFRRDVIDAIYEIVAKDFAANGKSTISRDEMLTQIIPVFYHWGYSQVIEQVESYVEKAYSSETHVHLNAILSSGKVPVFRITDNEIIVSEGKREEDSEFLYLIGLYRAVDALS